MARSYDEDLSHKMSWALKHGDLVPIDTMLALKGDRGGRVFAGFAEADVVRVVENDKKKMFHIKRGRCGELCVRANQGHSPFDTPEDKTERTGRPKWTLDTGGRWSQQKSGPVATPKASSPAPDPKAATPKAGFNLSQFDGLSGSPGKSQKEGQEDQGEIKELGGAPLAVLRSPGPPGLPSGSSLGSLTIHQTGLS